MKIQKEITTAKLLKYFKGELDQQEARAIESWASESEENEKTLMSLAKVYNLGQLARTYTEKEVAFQAPKGFDLSSAQLILQNYPISGNVMKPYEVRVYLWNK